jgi:3-oxoacyl-[acyl-carrier-protein] synthase III
MDDATDLPWWKCGGDFRIGSRDPARVKNLMRDTVTYGAQTIREASERASVPVGELAAIASVQPRGFLPGAIAERLGLPRERAATTYERVAHLGASGPVFNLVEARNRGMLPRGAKAAMYGQGAGFTRAAAVLEVV